MAFAGIVTSLASLLLLPFLEVRPNRIFEGLPVGAVAALGVWLALPVALLVLLAADALVRRRGRVLDVLASGAAGAGLASMFVLAGQAASRLAAADPSPTVRVSLGPGVWVAAIGFAVTLFVANRRLAARPAARALASLAPIAVVLAAGFAGLLDELSLVRELAARRDGFLGDLGRHLFLALAAVGLGVLAGVPLALAVHRSRRSSRPPSW